MRSALVVAQALTFVLLAAILLLDGDTRLAIAQLLLAVITVLVYV